MKLSKKDIKKEYFKEYNSRQGELTPILYKNGKTLIPTSEGYKEVNKNVKRNR